MACPGSVAMEALFPETEDTPEAAAGTAAHWALSEMLNGQPVALGQVAPNDIALTDEMLDAAEMAHDTIRARAPVGGRIEQRVSMPYIHPAMYGTPDFWDTIGVDTIYVADFKFGHRHVDVMDNAQLQAYGVGALGAPVGPGVRVILEIIQPRCYSAKPVRTWETTGAGLERFASRAREAAALAMSPNAPCVVNPECLDCRARHACPTLQSAALQAVAESGRSTPLSLDASGVGLELSILLRAQGLLKARIEGLEEQAKSTIRGGGFVPGWRMASTPGRTRWSKSDAEVIALGKMWGLDLAKPPQAVPVGAARKAGLPDVLIKSFADQPRGELTLVPDLNPNNIFNKE